MAREFTTFEGEFFPADTIVQVREESDVVWIRVNVRLEEVRTKEAWVPWWIFSTDLDLKELNQMRVTTIAFDGSAYGDGYLHLPVGSCISLLLPEHRIHEVGDGWAPIAHRTARGWAPKWVWDLATMPCSALPPVPPLAPAP